MSFRQKSVVSSLRSISKVYNRGSNPGTGATIHQRVSPQVQSSLLARSYSSSVPSGVQGAAAASDMPWIIGAVSVTVLGLTFILKGGGDTSSSHAAPKSPQNASSVSSHDEAFVETLPDEKSSKETEETTDDLSGEANTEPEAKNEEKKVAGKEEKEDEEKEESGGNMDKEENSQAEQPKNSDSEQGQSLSSEKPTSSASTEAKFD